MDIIYFLQEYFPYEGSGVIRAYRKREDADLAASRRNGRRTNLELMFRSPRENCKLNYQRYLTAQRLLPEHIEDTDAYFVVTACELI